MDLCGPMGVESINERKYILVIVDDYSRYTWNHFLRYKDETPETLQTYFQEEGIRHQMSTARTPEQNGVAKAIATVCYTQNHSLIIPRHEKTPYHIINERKPTLKHLHIFGCKCYIVRDGENLNKMKEKQMTFDHNSSDHVTKSRDMASDHDSSDPAPQRLTMASEQNGLGPAPQYTTDNPLMSELDLLFSPMLDEYFKGENEVVSKPSAVSDKQNTTQSTTTLVAAEETQLIIHNTPDPTTPTTQIHAEENNNIQADEAQFDAYELINPFATPVTKVGESSLHHPLEQVRGNPSKPVQTRRPLATNLKMCMFALTVSKAKPKNIKEAMADHAWIEAIQEELH
ncbi:retrovirus-related pol polyprotein from transposon TNT 1-94 [Tanacetum coccineum]